MNIPFVITMLALLVIYIVGIIYYATMDMRRKRKARELRRKHAEQIQSGKLYRWGEYYDL